MEKLNIDTIKQMVKDEKIRWTNLERRLNDMSCFMCKGDLENKNTTFMVELDNCIIIIKNVPSQVCKQCGEVSYSNEVAKQLEKLVNSVRNAITEITVINYTEKVA